MKIQTFGRIALWCVTPLLVYSIIVLTYATQSELIVFFGVPFMYAFMRTAAQLASAPEK